MTGRYEKSEREQPTERRSISYRPSLLIDIIIKFKG